MAQPKSSSESLKQNSVAAARVSANGEEKPAATDGVRRRTSKACTRCRLKKCKCDGQVPCARCSADDAICCYGRHKKSEKTEYSKGYVQMVESQNNLLRAGIQKMYGTRQFPNVEPEKDGKILTHKILEEMGVLNDPRDWENGHESEHAGDKSGQNSQSPTQAVQQTPPPPPPNQQQWGPLTPHPSAGLLPDSAHFNQSSPDVQYGSHHFDSHGQHNDGYDQSQHAGNFQNEHMQMSYSSNSSSEPSPQAQDQAFTPGSSAYAQFHHAPGIQLGGAELMQRGDGISRLQAAQHPEPPQPQLVNYPAPEYNASAANFSAVNQGPSHPPAYVNPSNLDSRTQDVTFRHSQYTADQYARNVWPEHNEPAVDLKPLHFSQMNAMNVMLSDPRADPGLP